MGRCHPTPAPLKHIARLAASAVMRVRKTRAEEKGEGHLSCKGPPLVELVGWVRESRVYSCPKFMHPAGVATQRLYASGRSGGSNGACERELPGSTARAVRAKGRLTLTL